MTQGAGGFRGGAGTGVPSPVGRRWATRLDNWTLEQVLLLASFLVSILSVLVLASADLSFLGPSLLLLLPGGIFTGVLLWRRPFPWTYLAAGIANSLVAFLAIPFGLVGVLLNPLLGARYSGFVLASLALLLALPAGISGYLQASRRTPPRPLREGVRTLHGFAAIGLVALTVGALMAGSFAVRSLSPGEGIDFTPPDTRVVQIAGSRFLPTSFNVTAGNVTRIIVFNEDGAPHTFTYAVNGTTYNHDVPARGGTARFLVLFTMPGTIPFWSATPGDTDMTGTMVVVPP